MCGIASSSSFPACQLTSVQPQNGGSGCGSRRLSQRICAVAKREHRPWQAELAGVGAHRSWCQPGELRGDVLQPPPHTGAQSPALGWGPPLSKGLGITFISVPSSPTATQIKPVPRCRWLPRRAPVASVRFRGGRLISQHGDPSVKIQRRD